MLIHLWEILLFSFLILLSNPFGKIMAQEKKQSLFIYVSLRNSNAIVVYKFDDQTSKLNLVDSLTVNGGPAPMGMDPTENYLYVGQREINTLSSFKIDDQTGKLSFINSIPAADNMAYVATDRTGKFLLTAYYASGKAAVYPINSEGQLQSKAVLIFDNYVNAHSILTDPNNKFAFIADKGGDKIYQYKFDENTGMLTPNAQPEIGTQKGTEPRHFVFHGSKDIVYFVNETNNTVTAYDIDKETGTLSSFQNISTIPEDFTEFTKAADIHISPDNRFLYASNRGHESIAAYKVDELKGELTTIGYFPTEVNPRSFAIEPSGNFLFCAGESSNNLVSYKINQETGELQKIESFFVGEVPSWVLVKLN
ncbi:MAG: lactonase family protein [Ignavibacteriae bacterium]|nr:lactonase family protein [Ignavibacteriota bacterium]